MISRALIGAGSAMVFLSGVAFAQSSTVTGAAGGAATGAIIGGPAGAAVGGVAGAAIGTALAPPPDQVVTYVREAPSTSVVVKEKVVVGAALPESVIVTQVPEYPKYAYAVVNDERVIVEPSSRKVIQIIH
jgi:hypothetical protein